MPNNELEIGACYEVLQRYTCKNRVTKSKIKMTRIKYLVNGKDVGRGTYLTCLDHNETRYCKNKTEALFQMRQPWVWCDGCAALHFNQEGYVDGDDEWVDAEKMMWNDKNGGF